jgi:LPXTG-motif cell wall-anchored protein
VPATSGSEEDDQTRLSRAYNNSIYLMAGMPYLLLGAVGFLVYRRFRAHELARQPILSPAHPLPPGVAERTGPPGDGACSLPSRGGDS